MIGIIDYGVGNLFSLKSSFLSLGEEVFVSGKKEELRQTEGLILPGVGAFADAAKKLKDSGLDEFVREYVKSGRPLMGICLGMQLLFEKSYEYGEHDGLSLLKGQVIPMEGNISEELKIPHIGWNSLNFIKDGCPLFKDTKEGDFVYFVHSYFAVDNTDSLVCNTEYGIPMTAAVNKDNIYGCQFHPEKSGKVGLAILKSFADLCK